MTIEWENMELISRAEMLELLKDAHKTKRIFSVEFERRKPKMVNGVMENTRKMVCMYGVQKHLKGGVKPYNDADYNLTTVFDLQAGGYRSIPLDGIFELKTAGKRYAVVQ